MKLNFGKILTDWYLQNKRDLPWRKVNDPYLIWLSEIILQQTRVVQGLPYYKSFVSAFPTVKDLANASEDEVIKLWQGLGYYSRARNLHAAAIIVMEQFGGVFPKTYQELLKLKGVGTYTASAVASFANNEPVAVVDGNVYRVLSRIYGISTPINTGEGEKKFGKLANSLLDTEDPATYNQAIMEFGALACTPKKPLCMYCPFQGECVAYNTNQVDVLPVKLKKTKIRNRFFNYFVVKSENDLLLEKRSKKDIWLHLFQFPMVESGKVLSLAEATSKAETLFKTTVTLKLLKRNEKAHKLSHQHIIADFYEVEQTILPKNEFLKVPLSELEQYAVPVLIANFLESEAFKMNSFS